MTEICLHPLKLEALLTELSRHRHLTEEEADMLEAVVQIDAEPFQWSARLERELLIAAASPGGIVRFARRHSINELAARQKLYRMRARNRRHDAKPRKKG